MFPKILGAILFVLAITAGWMMLHPVALPESHLVSSQDDDWRLPGQDRPDSVALAGKVDEGRLWGTGSTVPVEAKPLTAPNWRIAGVVSAGADSYALLVVDGQPPQQVKIGEELPGGVKVVSMTADRVCILLNGKKRMLRTYKE
jgi:hypothetical protein